MSRGRVRNTENPRKARRTVLASCKKEGEVHEVDHDTKDGICLCSERYCLVDGRNRVLS